MQIPWSYILLERIFRKINCFFSHMMTFQVVLISEIGLIACENLNRIWHLLMDFRVPLNNISIFIDKKQGFRAFFEKNQPFSRRFQRKLTQSLRKQSEIRHFEGNLANVIGYTPLDLPYPWENIEEIQRKRKNNHKLNAINRLSYLISAL